jgi:hypothetical protein
VINPRQREFRFRDHASSVIFDVASDGRRKDVRMYVVRWTKEVRPSGVNPSVACGTLVAAPS